MKSNRPLKTVEQAIKDNADKIDEYHIELDGFEDASPWSYWIYFKKGFINPFTETHCIHEPYAALILEQFKAIVPCDCEQCK